MGTTVSSLSFSTRPSESTDRIKQINEQATKVEEKDTPYIPQSDVQRKLAAQKAEATKIPRYDETEDFLRMKAFEIRSRIVMYQNLGLMAEYQQAQAEGAAVVKKYQALLKSGKIQSSNTTV